MATQAHRSDPRVLGRRTLERDHCCLAGLLRTGMTVLDVGCGTGSITSGIARAVGPQGHVIGIDRDETLLAIARRDHDRQENLRFECGDATNMAFREEFDFVTSARVLQWIADPALAISKMKDAAKRSGMLVVLDYNHLRNAWEPKPPKEFMTFYRAFLAWRMANGWDNEMADHLPELFHAAGLIEVRSYAEDEVARRGEADFDERAALWAETLDAVAGQLVEGGFGTERQLADARESYKRWTESEMVSQTLMLRAVSGIVT